MILTGTAIAAARARGEITIEPFSENHVGPNSYDFTLGERCKIYKNIELDAAKENLTDDLFVDRTGIQLAPGRIYLFNTAEIIGSSHFVPIIRGRSSVGRLGLFVHITADLINIGSLNQLTLQLTAMQPVRVYPGMLIGQVTFWQVEGEIEHYRGKYQGVQSPASSQSYTEFNHNGQQSFEE
jgi:dCTP deaminase